MYAATAGREDYVAGLVGEAFAETDDRAAALMRFVEDLNPGEVTQLHKALHAAKSARRRR